MALRVDRRLSPQKGPFEPAGADFGRQGEHHFSVSEVIYLGLSDMSVGVTNRGFFCSYYKFADVLIYHPSAFPDVVDVLPIYPDRPCYPSHFVLSGQYLPGTPFKISRWSRKCFQSSFYRTGWEKEQFATSVDALTGLNLALF